MSICIGNDLEDRLKLNIRNRKRFIKKNTMNTIKPYEIDHMSDLHVDSSFYKQSMKIINYVQIKD